MNSLLYLIAAVLVIAWAIGFFLTAVGAFIHVLLVVAAICLMLALVKRPTAV
jgi:hypothetical protein